ncbi:MAG: hypothetical protein U0M12_06055 [Acutalibacteraceae bacterium]|nr:hypothetical protein [Acutalibacteraceae bacterium]
MGRPTTEPKTETIKVRLSKNDIDILTQCQNISGKSKSEIIRLGISLVFNQYSQK